MIATALPPLPLDGWQPTKDTLHLFFQIVGKIKLVSEPPRNHWWHAPLYPTPRGVGTGPVAAGRVTFSIDFNLIAPEPPGLALAPLDPAAARWAPRIGSHLALLMYDDVRTSGSPRGTVLAFLESAYQAGGALAGWDVAGLRSSFAPVPPPRS